jgi:catalase
MEHRISQGRESQSAANSYSPLAILSQPGALVKLAAIGVFVLGIVGSFAYVAGWFSPHELTPRRFTNGFQAVNGIHPGFRRNHAKGLCINGYFDSNGQGIRLSKVAVFEPGRDSVMGRFSIGGGQPYAADDPNVVRGMALRFQPSHGQEWRTAMIDLPVFPVRNLQGFYQQLIATKVDPATGKPDPAKMTAFLAAHPEVIHAKAIIQAKPFSFGFANATFNGLNTFWFENSAGISTPLRWSTVPVDPFVATDATAPANKNYLFDDFIGRVQRGPVQWHMILTVGQPGDPTDDASIVWPDNREHVDAGTLSIDSVEGEASGNCRDINFDPLVLPNGITPSNDPLLSARSSVYSVSFRRREREKKQPSAVEISEKGKGA